MRLVDFIEGTRERIVDAWQNFAGSLPPFEGQVSVAELHEHAGRMLDAIAGDMRSPAGSPEHAGESGQPAGTSLGGSEHGLQRHAAGLSLVAMTSEFRALRAVVLRLWAGAGFVRSAEAFEDLLRFNEALDRITASAVLSFAQAAERDRALLMGIVAHDLRGPLHTVSMASHILARRHPVVREDEAMGQIRRSLARMLPMVDDLMGVAAAGLHSRMAVRPQTMDLAALVAEIVSEVAAEFPGHRFVFHPAEAIEGEWDRARLGQLASNLLRNAAVHGDAGGLVRVHVGRQERVVVLSIHNTGPAIPEAERARLFSPTARGANAKVGAHLGLGLFIVQEIARGHGGTVGMTSDPEGGTVFSVFLPFSSEPDAGDPIPPDAVAKELARFVSTTPPAHPDPTA